MSLLRRAKEILSHQIPTGEFSKVVAYALKRLVKQMDPLEKKPAAVKRGPSRANGSAMKANSSVANLNAFGTANPSAADQNQSKPKSKAQIRRDVFQANDGGCCFVGADGHVCNERSFVQADHVVPLGIGGEDTLQNQRPLCRTHNLLEAERIYGKAHMDKFRRSNREAQRSPTR